MNICFITSELFPLAKTGGLADVVAALATYLHRQGHDVRVLLPFYSAIDPAPLSLRPAEGLQALTPGAGDSSSSFSIDRTELPGTSLPVYLLRCPELYNRPGLYTDAADESLRFALLSRAALQMCQHMAWAPDIIHCNDWHTGLVPLYLRSLYAWDRLFSQTRSVLTIHNIGYQGIFDAGIVQGAGLADSTHLLHQEDFEQGRINFLKTGILYADALTTVSPRYAQEIQTDEYGLGLQGVIGARADSLFGILNGVDYGQWNPETDELIPHRYSAANLGPKEDNKKALMHELGLRYREGVPLIGVVSRLTSQKGIDLIAQALPGVLERRPLSLAILGSGEPAYEQFFARLQNRARDRVCFYRGFSNPLAHMIEAGSDLFLMPSRYEPCGLNQMYSLKYGTIPIVRRTGGLADTVAPYDPDTREGTGIVFEDYSSEALSWALNTALDLYADRDTRRQLRLNAMAEDFSWDKQGAHYVALYERLMK